MQRSKIILINQEIFYILTLNEEKGVFFVYGRGKRLSLSLWPLRIRRCDN